MRLRIGEDDTLHHPPPGRAADALADLRILFDDVDQAVKRGHGLIHLSRRLPSRLHLRQTQAEDAEPGLCFAVGV
ncbi:MAG TPA: hypothetical protein VFX91_12045 [Alcanivorax sp.]|nr:hypothetical protein [Alcanivorax sp.]